jgi:hypothetical protein
MTGSQKPLVNFERAELVNFKRAPTAKALNRSDQEIIGLVEVELHPASRRGR